MEEVTIAIAIILGGESSDSVVITFFKVANPTLPEVNTMLLKVLFFEQITYLYDIYLKQRSFGEGFFEQRSVFGDPKAAMFEDLVHIWIPRYFHQKNLELTKRIWFCPRRKFQPASI